MFRTFIRFILTLAGIFSLLFGAAFFGPTGLKQNFVKLYLDPKARKLHEDLSAALKLDDAASAALKETLVVTIRQGGVAIIISASMGSFAVGISLLSLSACLKKRANLDTFPA